MSKPLPPFGEVVKAFSSYQINSRIYIFCGKSAWDDAQRFISNAMPCLCLPFGKNPTDYFWPVQNADFVLCDTGGMDVEQLHSFCIELLAFGAKSILLFSEKTPIEIFNNKEF